MKEDQRSSLSYKGSFLSLSFSFALAFAFSRIFLLGFGLFSGFGLLLLHDRTHGSPCSNEANVSARSQVRDTYFDHGIGLEPFVFRLLTVLIHFFSPQIRFPAATPTLLHSLQRVRRQVNLLVVRPRESCLHLEEMHAKDARLNIRRGKMQDAETKPHNYQLKNSTSIPEVSN